MCIRDSVHATNIPYTGRSHFDGQNLMESGGTIPYKLKTGWLGRGIDVAGLEGLSMSLPMPLLLRGKANQDNFFPSKLSMPTRNLVDILKHHYDDEPLLKKSFDKLIRPGFRLVITEYTFTPASNNFCAIICSLAPLPITRKFISHSNLMLKSNFQMVYHKRIIFHLHLHPYLQQLVF